MRHIFLSTFALLCLLATAGHAQKIGAEYFNCKFGETFDIVSQKLTDANQEPILTEDGIFLKDKDIYGVTFGTIGMKFTKEDTFFNIFGYNKFDNKKEATAAFDKTLSSLREQFSNIQSMSKTDNCLRLYAYTDEGHENVLSLGLYKGNNGTFFVRINIYSDYLVRRSNGE